MAVADAPVGPVSRRYPVHVQADPQPVASRWLWLVKWLLAIPHYVVLAFLWIAFVVVSVVAFFAILFTGRYPRALFDFNVGVLRWTWRVAYYALRRPGHRPLPAVHAWPTVPDYPAHLDVAYPERLSRGLVLVKWWLLAIPQYIIVGVFVGGGHVAGPAVQRPAGSSVWGGGLVGLLVLVAAVAAAVHRPLPAAAVRLHPRHGPLGAAGGRLRWR